MSGREVRGTEKCLKEMRCVHALTWVGVALKVAACSRTPLAFLGLPFRNSKALQSVQYFQITKWKGLVLCQPPIKQTKEREKVIMKTSGTSAWKYLLLHSSDRELSGPLKMFAFARW